MDVFQLEGVTKDRGDNFTLGPMSLHLSPGEILGVMGPNGAGKTTLLRMLWGFLRPDGGRVSVFGRSPHLEQVWVRLRAGYLSEAPEFYRWMTARRFLSFIAGFYPSWEWSRADRLIEDFELDGGKKVGELSKGNRIKLGLIAAIAHRPQLLILDEPTSGLDPVIRIDILEFLHTLSRDDGAGVVMSSHVSDDLDRIADSVLMLNEGRVVEYAPAAVLLDRYGKSQLEDVFLHAIGRVPTARAAHSA